MKNFFYAILVLAILIVLFDLLPSGKGYWAGNYPDCYSIDQCEFGARGFMKTKSLGFIEIPYHLSECPKQPTTEEKQHEKQLRKDRIKQVKKEEEERSVKRLQELFE